MPAKQHIRLERTGDRQTLRIPQEYELTSDEALLHKEGDCLIIEPVRKPSLLDVLANLEPIAEPFPDVDSGLPPLDDVAF